jgi:uncharacterized protein YlxP (DUF503 family)
MYLESAFSDGYSLIEKRNIVEEVMASRVKVKFFSVLATRTCVGI